MLFLLVACHGDRSAPGPAQAAIDIEALPRLTLTEELRIGSIDDADYGFSQVGGVTVDRDGQIIVFEGQDLEFRIYSPNGKLVRRFGGRGGGPGEFRFGVDFGVLGDTIWTTEWRMRRLTLFDRAGRVISSTLYDTIRVPWHYESRAMSLVPGALRSDGLFISKLGPPEALYYRGKAFSREFRDTIDVPRVRFDSKGKLVDTIGRYQDITRPTEYVDVGKSRYLIPARPPVHPQSILTSTGQVFIGPGTAHDAEEGTFDVTWVDVAGDTMRSRTYRYRPLRFTEKLLDGMVESAIRTGTASVGRPANEEMNAYPEDAAAGREAVRARMNFPEFHLPIGSVRVGSDGALWLSRESTEGNTLRSIVLDLEGNPLGELELPRSRFRIAWTSGDTVWAVEPDQLDVPWLVRYRIMQ